jgi:tetratricopeptide (TPR) repeat protein
LGKLDPATGQLKLSMGYRLSTEKGELIAEDAEESAYAAYDPEQNRDRKGAFQPFQVGNRLPLVPGNYKLEVLVTNRDTARTYKGEQKIVAGPGKQVSLTGPLMASSVARVARPDAVTPFQYFGIQFHPASGRKLIRREPLRLLFELQEGAGAAPKQYEIEYLLAHIHEREMRRTLNDSVTPDRFQNGRLLMSKTIPLTELDSGDYRLVVNLRAAGSQEVLTSANLPIRIEDEQSDAPLYFLANSRNIAARGVAAYIRALESVAEKNDAAATDYLRQALDQNPANTYAGQYLVQLYFNSRKFAPVTELYKRLGITPFKASAETLAQISVSFWQTGDRGQAREVLQAAQDYFPKNPLLAATASNLK